MTNEEVVHLRKVKQSGLPDVCCLTTEAYNSTTKSDANFSSNYDMVKHQEPVFENVNSSKRKISVDKEGEHKLENEQSDEQPPRTKLRISVTNYPKTPACNNEGEIDPLFSLSLDSKYTVAEVLSDDNSLDDDFGDSFCGPEPKAPKIREPWMTPHNTTQYIFSQHENDPVNENCQEVLGYEYLVSQYASLHGID